ncbi:MAG: hypothetical protein JO354_04525 [Verrucomicrobia bacterium]|nr:hypothetical protein [Verrucomicrobiota bacterium]
MRTQLAIATMLALGLGLPCRAGTDIVRDYSAQAPPPTYTSAPPPAYYVPPPPVRVIVYPAYVPVVRVFGFHRYVRPRAYCARPYWR